jgi:hypothetical protein
MKMATFFYICGSASNRRISTSLSLHNQKRTVWDELSQQEAQWYQQPSDWNG